MNRAAMAHWTDQEAAEMCRSGGAFRDEAFRQLYQRYAPEFLAFARRILGDQGWAEDVVQESFVRLYQSFDHYQPERPLRPYLFKINHNVALKTLRSSKKLKAGNKPGENREAEAQEAPDEAADKELQGIVTRALQNLAPEHRSILALRHMSGLKLKDIAEILSCTERTVRNRLHTAATLFERELARHGLQKESRE